MKASVVVGARNVRPYLHMALESIAWQIRPFDEVLVIGDQMSTDGTCSFARWLCDQLHYKYIETTDSGIGAMKDMGIKATHGDVWCFLGGDDFYHPAYLSDTMALMRDRSFSFTNWKYVSTKGAIEDKAYPLPYAFPMVMESAAFRPLAWAMVKEEIPYGVNNSTIAVDRAILDDISFDPSLKAGEDLAFLMESLPYTNTYYSIPQHRCYCREWYDGCASMDKGVRDTNSWRKRMNQSIHEWYQKNHPKIEDPIFKRTQEALISHV